VMLLILGPSSNISKSISPYAIFSTSSALIIRL
jgi:hypothetical protein